MDKCFLFNCHRGLGPAGVCGCRRVWAAVPYEQDGAAALCCGQLPCCARSVTRFVHRRVLYTRTTKRHALGGRGDRVEQGMLAGLCRSEVAGVAQLDEVLPWVGFFQSAIGAVLDAQLPFMRLLGAPAVAHSQVGGKVHA